MNSINFQASFNNLAQVDRAQQDIHRMPLVNQEQNAEINRQKAAQRNAMPVQPDQVEGKKIDPEDRRNEGKSRKRKRPFQQPDDSGLLPGKKTGGGFIDISI